MKIRRIPQRKLLPVFLSSSSKTQRIRASSLRTRAPGSCNRKLLASSLSCQLRVHVWLRYVIRSRWCQFRASTSRSGRLDLSTSRSSTQCIDSTHRTGALSIQSTGQKRFDHGATRPHELLDRGNFWFGFTARSFGSCWA